jgi:hypothetical protein
MKAVFNLPEKPNPRSRGFESVLCPKAHHMRDAHELASPVAFFHLAVNQTWLHTPPAHGAPTITQREPLTKVGGERIEVQM